MLENHMVIGDYYPEPEAAEPDEDALYEQWRDFMDEIKQETEKEENA